MSEFANKRYVVTGAASGIGHAVALQLLAGRAEVVSLDRNTPTANVTRHIAVDLSDPSSIDSAVGQLDGKFDGLMNVAGVPGTTPADLVVAVNTLAAKRLTELFVDRLNPGGTVTIVSSTAGFGWPARLPAIQEFLSASTFEEGAAWWAANPQQGNAYNFSKEAATVYAMSQSLAMAQLGLRINAVLPGPVETPILADFEDTMGKEVLDGLKGLLGRHATADDIANAVVFLASDAARWINGHALVADGGAMGAVLSGLIPAPSI
jgi:NAD(P)-dependent dehydrogenase (short-subunit alcohol dehydrogenase family)